MPPLALVVENDTGTRKLLEVLLERQGLEVDATASGENALVLLKHVDYAVIVLDLILGALSGLDVLAALAPERQERVVVLSSATERQLAEVRAKYPAVLVMRKPFDLVDLVEAVTRKGTAERPRSFMETFCRASVRAGAKSGVLLTLDASKRALQLVTAFGYAPGMIEDFCPIHVDAPYPIAAAHRNGVPVWLASLTLAAPDYPLLSSVWALNESKALAALPVKRGDAVVGSIGWSFREPQQFTAQQREAFALIADIAADHLQVPAAPQSETRSTA